MSLGVEPLVVEGGKSSCAVGVAVEPVLSLWRAHQEANHQDPKYITQSHRAVRLLCTFAKTTDVRAITRPVVLKYRDHLCAKYESGSTINNHLAALRQFFEWAVSIEELRENPAETVKNAPRNDGDGNREFTTEEAARMIDAARADEASAKPTHGAIRSPSYILAWNTGLRSIELGRLWKEDARGIGTVDAYFELHWTKTKNRRAVQIPLNHEAQQELAKWLPRIDHPRDPIFPTSHTPGLPQLPHERVVNRDIKAAGIAKKDEWGAPVGFHSFRKGGATALAAGGAPIETVSRFLRHSDPKLTQKVYIRLRRKQLGQTTDSVPSVDNSPEPAKAHKCVDNGGRMGDTGAVTLGNTTTSTASRPRPLGPGVTSHPRGSGRSAVISNPSGSPSSVHLRTSEIAGAGFEPAPAVAGAGNGITLNLTISPEAIGAFIRAIVSAGGQNANPHNAA